MHAAAAWPIALALAGTVALLAWRSGHLRSDGALAAWAIGAVSLRAAWSWGAYLIIWFALASVLSRIGRARKAARTGAIIAKGGQRDAWQVLANGGVFALAAFGAATGMDSSARVLAVAGASALAAAGADTWATEIGTLIGGEPWSLRERRIVTAGTSGAVTWSGTAGALAGGTVLALIASALGMIPIASATAVAMGGVAGAFADTIVGAWWQERRFCPACQQRTERLEHGCGTATVREGGVARLDNDVVNLLCTAVGALVALALLPVIRDLGIGSR